MSNGFEDIEPGLVSAKPEEDFVVQFYSMGLMPMTIVTGSMVRRFNESERVRAENKEKKRKPPKPPSRPNAMGRVALDF